MSGRLAVFDCDGTLVDGQAEVCEAMESAFRAQGLAPPPRHAVRRIVGLSLPMAIRRLAPDAGEERALALVQGYKRAFFEKRRTGALFEPLFTGVEPLLRRLHGRGWLLAVATGKSERGLRACLESHGIADLFVSLQTADRHPSKPDPAMLLAAIEEAAADPRDAVMIGDTSFDMAMAREAGVRAIGVSWGYHEESELIAAGAEAVATSPEQLENLLQ